MNSRDKRIQDNRDKKEYSIFAKSKIFSENVWCPFCYGSGSMRRRKGRKNLDPRIEIIICTRCKGMRRVWAMRNSKLWKKAMQVVPGIWPGMRKSKVI